MSDERLRVRPVYRSEAVRTFGLAYGVVFGAVMILFCALSWGEWDVVSVCAAGLAFAVLMFVRVGGGGVYVEDDGIRVRSIFRTRRLAWSEIASFVFVPYGACRIKLKRPGAAPVAITAIQQRAYQAALRTKGTQEQELIEELNALLERHRRPPSSPGPS